MTTTFPYSNHYDPPAPFADITVSWIDEVNLSALIDSGSDTAFMPIDVLRIIDADYVETRQIRGITEISRSASVYRVNVQIGLHTIHAIRAVAGPHGSEPIIGRDVLNHLIITLDGIGSLTEIS